MKIAGKDLYFLDRTMLVIIALILSVIVWIAMSFSSVKNIRVKNRKTREYLNLVHLSTDDLLHIRSLVESKEKKIGLTKSTGIVSTLEQIIKGLGMEAEAIKPLKKTKAGEFTEENAELEIRKTDLNRIVNLLYKIDNSPIPMKIKNAMMKTSFEHQEEFTLKLTVSLIGR